VNALKVKRDGQRGWHWIDASRFDPAVHVLHDENADQASEPEPAHAQIAPADSPKRRKRKAD
jgi:hypothetical protein